MGMIGGISDMAPAEEHTRACEWPGCREPGAHRAPRSRQNLRSYRWFCLSHVREYNKGWSYYEGMNEAEIEADVRLDTVWRRPSWRLGMGGFPSFPDGLDDPFGLFDDWGRNTKPAWQSPEAKAMAVLDLSPPLTTPALKARYKKLVKRHHPDANGGDKACEERFKQISQAYETLMDSLAPRMA
ncbi:MAG: J domain-containing protein [Proteobacteria bacterium]|nr:J domain-containing protein [Pseudomonadota bacterium]